MYIIIIISCVYYYYTGTDDARSGYNRCLSLFKFVHQGSCTMRVATVYYIIKCVRGELDRIGLTTIIVVYIIITSRYTSRYYRGRAGIFFVDFFLFHESHAFRSWARVQHRIQEFRFRCRGSNDCAI